MHICIIAPEQFPLPGDGSVEICINAIARVLAERHQVTLISRKAPGLPGAAEEGKLRFVRLAADSPAIYQSSVLNYVQGQSFDLVQVDNRPQLMAAVQARLFSVPVVLFLHSLTFVPPSEATARALARADWIIVNSRSLQHRIARRFPGLGSGKLRVVPLGADLTRFTPADPQEMLRLRSSYRLPGSFTVLFVGRVIPRKGVPLLIRAMQQLNRRLPAHLVVAGRVKPPYLRRLKRLARKQRVSVSFLGSIGHEEIHRLYQAADCFVCPSQRHEAFGLVNVEAMACGLPVIASSNGGIREIISSGHNGYLIEHYREPQPFARRLLALARNPQLAARIGAQGRKDVLEAFDWRHTAAALEAIYNSAVVHVHG
ncbi:glycosyltransferase family 4 protein [Paenibacillus donghaensis]|uniref:Spore coat protein n=1 Tax=Paenibacillus donghaensis TaxID=414771 RepID=A0A2Z2KNN7_9BACL|nr:glycosyltransferase family 4 protein [Paenibacillus donghaensis]ASA25260.1 spore coat protein [Paenibacillus donghaensis]